MIIRLTMRSVVVLPQPEGPTRTVIWPVGASSVRSSTATDPVLPSSVPDASRVSLGHALEADHAHQRTRLRRTAAADRRPHGQMSMMAAAGVRRSRRRRPPRSDRIAARRRCRARAAKVACDDLGDERGPEPGPHEHRVVGAGDADERGVAPLRLHLLDAARVRASEQMTSRSPWMRRCGVPAPGLGVARLDPRRQRRRRAARRARRRRASPPVRPSSDRRGRSARPGYAARTWSSAHLASSTGMRVAVPAADAEAQPRDGERAGHPPAGRARTARAGRRCATTAGWARGPRRRRRA